MRGRTLVVVVGALLACAALAARLAGQPAPPTPLRLLTAAGMRPLPTVMLNGVEMIALDDLASTFQATVRDDALTRARIEHRFGDRQRFLVPVAVDQHGGVVAPLHQRLRMLRAQPNPRMLLLPPAQPQSTRPSTRPTAPRSEPGPETC